MSTFSVTSTPSRSNSVDITFRVVADKQNRTFDNKSVDMEDIKIKNVRTFGRISGAIAWFFGFAAKLSCGGKHNGKFVSKASYLEGLASCKIRKDMPIVYDEKNQKNALPYAIEAIKKFGYTLRDGIDNTKTQFIWTAIKNEDFTLSHYTKKVF